MFRRRLTLASSFCRTPGHYRDISPCRCRRFIFRAISPVLGCSYYDLRRFELRAEDDISISLISPLCGAEVICRPRVAAVILIILAPMMPRKPRADMIADAMIAADASQYPLPFYAAPPASSQYGQSALLTDCLPTFLASSLFSSSGDFASPPGRKPMTACRRHATHFLSPPDRLPACRNYRHSPGQPPHLRVLYVYSATFPRFPRLCTSLR